MAKTLTQVQQQIEKLQQVAARLQQAEVQGVIDRIKGAIEAYGLTAADLFDSRASTRTQRVASKTRPAPQSVSKSKSKSKSKLSTQAQYADGSGNEWVGRGPRPKWLREAIAAGKSLSDFAVDGASAKAKPSRAGQALRRPTAKKRVVAVKYRDGDNTWTGRGSKPRWIREALEQGKSVQDFLV
ncbi:MAG: H-NS histone family protein [Pseudomonadota bacterium]|nr:H-NS histone family protein [Pseudomonadota bacterium]